MRIPIDRDSEIPLYQQIETYIRQGILSGSIASGTRLPASRVLANDLGVNRITVENAYAELEADNLVHSKVGSGTYVMPSYPTPSLPKDVPGAPWPLWQQDLEASRGSRLSDELETQITSSRHPDLIRFDSGVGDSILFPVEEFRKILQAVLRRDGLLALEYGDPLGYAPLRSTIAHVLASQGLQTNPENILITAGSQQAITLAAQLLLKPGDAVIVESPTYARVLELLQTLQCRVVSIPVDDQGMQIDGLEILLQQHHPRLIYTIPNFQNPTGSCLSLNRRRHLLSLADRYNVPILEDDYVGDLRYEGHALPALKALDPGGRVIYVSTFSKMLMPGLRVGFLVADGPVQASLLHFKRMSDLATSNLAQRALESFVTVGRYQAHLHRACQLYRKRRDTMLRAIRGSLPAGVQVCPPQGGLFIWMRLPEGLENDQLLPLALAEGVSYAAGECFFNNRKGGAGFMRLNFAAQSPERIETGIRRLGKAMRRLRPFTAK
ncbi:MAG: PLP-dependent aminotransferase family protein [Chloroflexota bacterium]|nr:MAG: PLP-dependent aminotransferase family protein [Chloroflexota bacterium]